MTEYVRPKTLSEALELRAEHPDWILGAGGTDLMVGGLPTGPGFIDIFGLTDIVGVKPRGEDLWVGASTTYSSLLHHDRLRRRYPGLVQCISDIGAVQIQNRGTLGGNIATSSPVGDTLPMLLALDASIELAGPKGLRLVPYREFCTGYRQTAMKDTEIISGVLLPRSTAGGIQFWRKVGTRQAQAISKVAVAAFARVDDGSIAEFRLAMGAVADRPIRLEAVEDLVTGKKPDAKLADQAAEVVERMITPIDDVRSSADYRREVAANITRRFVLGLA